MKNTVAADIMLNQVVHLTQAKKQQRGVLCSDTVLGSTAIVTQQGSGTARRKYQKRRQLLHSNSSIRNG